MLPSVIEKLEDAAEGDRQHYVQCHKVGSPEYLKFVLQLDDKHPVQLKNIELLKEASKFADTKTRLEAKAIPDGKIAADPVTVELGETAGALGFKTKKELSDFKSNADSTASKLAEETESKTNARVATAAGKNADAWAEHAKDKKLKFEETTIKDADGKDVIATIVVHKDADGKEVKTPLKEYADKNAAHVAAAKPEKRRSGFGFPKEDQPEGELNEFEQIEKDGAERNKAKATGNVSFADKFFGRSNGING